MWTPLYSIKSLACPADPSVAEDNVAGQEGPVRSGPWNRDQIDRTNKQIITINFCRCVNSVVKLEDVLPTTKNKCGGHLPLSLVQLFSSERRNRLPPVS
ncbi:hypothetical protein Zmor_019929 [Zophobas morio]|uniref:Uncharacterized protein n=1 Tax=Zophobas morio TaxID=2755281 RepID=A0AA38I380_9CUCU|nr:hypothetical protein Zmor_019929 [Zophobas morio]